MQSKLIAARTALHSGVKVFIGNGTGANKLIDILNGHGDGTYISHDDQYTVPTNKQWISFTEVSGKVFIDEGAKNALLTKGKKVIQQASYKLKENLPKVM